MTVSIVNLDNREMLIGCLRALHANTRRASLETYVVDNASTDGSVAAAKSHFPQVGLIQVDHVQGFSTNNNLAFQRATGRYLLLLNNDTLVQPGAVDQLVEFMDAHAEAGACGARLLNPDGSVQPCFGRFPGLADFYDPLPARVMPRRWELAEPTHVDSVSGACMMVRREAADQVGLLDTDFDPVYVEEREWCYRIKRAGWHIYHVPQAQVVHFGGQTIGRTADRMTPVLYRNRVLFCRKHRHPAYTLLYRAVLAATTVPKVVYWAARSGGTRPDALARRRLRCQLDVLVSSVTGYRGRAT